MDLRIFSSTWVLTSWTFVGLTLPPRNHASLIWTNWIDPLEKTSRDKRRSQVYLHIFTTVCRCNCDSCWASAFQLSPSLRTSFYSPRCPTIPTTISRKARRCTDREDFTLFISMMSLKTGTRSWIRLDMVSIRQSGLSETYSRYSE